MQPEDRKRTAHKAVVTQVLEGDGRASLGALHSRTRASSSRSAR